MRFIPIQETNVLTVGIKIDADDVAVVVYGMDIVSKVAVLGVCDRS